MRCPDFIGSDRWKPEIKLIVSDMDGTLLDSQGRIREEFFVLFDELKSRDIMFIACSGRFYAQMVRSFQRVKGGLILIAHNGAVIQRSSFDKAMYERNLDAELVKFALAQLYALDLDDAEIYLAAKDMAYTYNPSAALKAEFKQADVDFFETSSLFLVDEGIKKIELFQQGGLTESTIAKVKAAFRGSSLECVVSGRIWLDIMSVSINKGKALSMIQERFRVAPENTMVFGDYYNDLDLFQQAKYSFAMANAPAEVQKAARFVAPDNDSNGVLSVIKNYLEEKSEFFYDGGRRELAY